MVTGLIIIGILTRFIPHVPNFSPLVGIALFSGVYLRKKYSYLIPIVIYVISDIIIGLHGIVLFTWGSIALIYWLGHKLKTNKTPVKIATYTLISSVIFFIVTNFGVWLQGWYSYTLGGLLKCYIAALPFFRTSLLADFIYVAVLFGTYEYILKRSRNLPQRDVAF